MLPNAIDVITLLVDDITKARSFYGKLFTPDIVYEDEVSAVLSFNGVMITCSSRSRRPSWWNRRRWRLPLPACVYC